MFNSLCLLTLPSVCVRVIFFFPLLDKRVHITEIFSYVFLFIWREIFSIQLDLNFQALGFCTSDFYFLETWPPPLLYTMRG